MLKKWDINNNFMNNNNQKTQISFLFLQVACREN